MTMVIKFSDVGGTTAMMDALNALSGWTIHGEFTNDGFPADCSILRAVPDGLRVCDIEDDGTPIPHAGWLIGYDEIISITVI
jgi:hypothetical protein